MLTTRPNTELVPKVGAGCLVLLGFFMALAAILGMTDPTGEPIAGLLVLGTLGVGFGAAGVAWWRFVTGSEVRRRFDHHDKVVLALAATHAGVVTVAQVAVETELTADEARAALDRLCSRGLARPDIQDDGSIEYRFGGLLGR